MFLMSNNSNARLLRSVLFAVLLLGAALAIWVAFGGKHAAAEQPNRAGLVVTFSDGSTLSRCIEFSEEEINGVELLTRSGLPLVSWGTGAGAAICKIGDEGCNNPNDCFCECNGSDCQYWAYYALQDGQWQYASAGASLRKVHNGDVDGWAWGSGKAGQGAMPPLLTFEEICPPVVPTVAPVPPTEPPLVPATQPPAPPVTQETAIAPTATAGTVAAASPPGDGYESDAANTGDRDNTDAIGGGTGERGGIRKGRGFQLPAPAHRLCRRGSRFAGDSGDPR